MKKIIIKGCQITFVLFILFTLLVIFVVAHTSSSGNQTSTPVEPTKASESNLNKDMTKKAINNELTSGGLNKADLAKYAQDTYGWDCDEVVKVDKHLNPNNAYINDSDIDFYGSGKVRGHKKYDVVTCSSGLKLRVYKRVGTYPYITDTNGGFDSQ